MYSITHDAAPYMLSLPVRPHDMLSSPGGHLGVLCVDQAYLSMPAIALKLQIRLQIRKKDHVVMLQRTPRLAAKWLRSPFVKSVGSLHVRSACLADLL